MYRLECLSKTFDKIAFRFVRCTEPRFHAFFHEDLAFLYNPFTVELEASSVICGWASEEHIQQDTEYIEDHVNPEGRVYHTFVLYGLKVWVIGIRGPTYVLIAVWFRRRGGIWEQWYGSRAVSDAIGLICQKR